MSESKMTPGPWEWDGKPGQSCLAGPGLRKVIEYAGYEGMWMGAYDQEIDLRNARAIAAVPELVAALQRAERKLMAYVGVCSGDKELTDAVLPMAQAALAKALGQ